MNIKLIAAKNIYGARQPVGKVLLVGTEVPKWQAEKLIETGCAVEFTPPKNEAVKEISDDQATDKAGINKNNQWSPSYSKTDSKTVENKGEIEIEVNKNSNLSANDNVVSAANYETEFSGNKDIVNDEVKTNAVFNQPNSRVDLENKKEQLMVLEDINVPQAQLSLLESTFEFESERIDIHGPKEKLFNFGLRNVGIGAGVYKESFAYGNSEMDSRMKASTSSTNATSYGVNLGFQLYKKWMLYTGLELYARNEQFTYQELSNNYILNIDTVKGKVHIPGQPDQEVVRYDSTYVNDGNHQQMSVTNKTSYYEIPLTLSYRMWSNRKLAIALNPGVRVGILNAQKGMTLDAAYKPVTINGEKAVEQYNNVNLNAEIGLDLDYKLYRRANLFLQPKVRQGLGNLMDNKAGFNKSNTSFGIFGGIRYEF